MKVRYNNIMEGGTDQAVGFHGGRITVSLELGDSYVAGQTIKGVIHVTLKESFPSECL